MAEFLGNLVFFVQGPCLVSLNYSTKERRVHSVHTDTITVLRKHNEQLFTASLDGKVTVWEPPTFSQVDCCSGVSLLAVTSKSIYFQKTNSDSLGVVDRSNLKVTPETILKGLVGEAIDLKTFPDESQLGVLNPHELLLFNLTTHSTRSIPHSVRLSAFAIHPQLKYLAIGDVGGQIFKIHGQTKEKDHWHSHKVSTLEFAGDGSHMTSGGEEGVLVLWYEATKKKNFLPRLGSPILSAAIKEDSSLYAVKLLDNSVKVIQASDFRVVCSYTGLTDPSKIIPGSRVFTGLVRNQNQLYMNGAPGYLQTFNPYTFEVTRIDCSNRNPVSRSEVLYPNPLQVVQVAFLEEFTATLEVSDTPHLPLSYLKFWKEGSIHTLVLHPHYDTAYKLLSGVNSIFSLGENSMRCWKNSGKSWVCEAEKEHHKLKTADISLHEEGVAVAYEHIIVHYNSDLEVVRKMYEPDSRCFQELKECQSNLVARSKHSLHVFKKGVILWSLELGYLHSIYSENKYFLLGLNASKYTPKEKRKQATNIILKFQTESPKPLKIYKVAEPKAYALFDGQTVVFDKDFNFANLDSSAEKAHESLPEVQKDQMDIEETKETQINPPRYLSTKALSSIEHQKSFELPSMHTLFQEIVCKELSALSIK